MLLKEMAESYGRKYWETGEIYCGLAKQGVFLWKMTFKQRAKV